MLTREEALATRQSPETEVKLQTLLVAYDFSAFAEMALEYAVQLAHKHHSEIAIAYIEQPADIEAEMESGLGAMNAARAQTERDLRSIAQRLRDQGISSASYCRAGTTSDVLVQLAAEIRPDLLLLGAYGHARRDAQRLGSTAEFLLRCLPCPTLTIGPQVVFAGQLRVPRRHIVYASSIPTRLARAARFAQIFAQTWGADVEIMHVIDAASPGYDSRRNAEMDVRGGALAQKFREIGINAHWSLHVGSPPDKILERARQLCAELILFGIEHHTVDATIMGTISKTIQQAVCPVLTVPGPA